MQDVCVLWDARVIAPPPNPGTTRDTCTPRHCKYEKLGKKLCVVGEPGCRPGAEVRTYTKCQSTRRISLVPQPFHMCEKEDVVF